jgi:protein O-GlcNAc transferase
MIVQQQFDAAVAHHRAGRLGDAEKIYRDVLGAQPNHSDALHLLGMIAAQTGRLEAAITLVGQAIGINPNIADYHNTLGNVLRNRGAIDEAIKECRRAIQLKPGYAEAFNTLGVALSLWGLFDEAIATYRQAVALQPNYAEAHSNLGNALCEEGLLDEAMACFDRAVALAPHNPRLMSNRIYMLHFHPDFGPEAILRQRMRWDDLFGKPLRSAIKPHTNGRDPNRRLRVGYVSPDIRNHSVGRFLLPLMRAHNPLQVETFCYCDVVRPDEITEQTRKYSHQWCNIVGISDADVAAAVRADGIDVLVDLAMHMARSRPLLFARKPAPVQVAWLAYAGTTGMSAIDYRLTDPFLDPPGQNDAHYVEESVRLPETFWCYEPMTESPVSPLPAISSGFVTFGCLNNFCKITPETIEAWCAILAAVPNSRLILHAHPGSHRDRTRQKLMDHGIDPRRLEFVEKLPLQQYLEQYNRIDIALDTFPYGGGTTTCDALWMGVPVVSLLGQTAVGRGGFSILMNLGLPELVAKNEHEYIQIAAALAADRASLTDLRLTLRDRMKRSPLLDAPRFASNIELAYRHIWRNWCDGGL